MYEEIRQIVEDRRTEWLETTFYPHSKDKTILEARCQELSWVLRLLDALD